MQHRFRIEEPFSIIFSDMNNKHNIATETTRLQKNMAALGNLFPSKNLTPICPSDNSAPLSF